MIRISSPFTSRKLYASSAMFARERLVSRWLITALYRSPIFSGLVIYPSSAAFSFIHFMMSCCLLDRSKSLVECRLLAYLSAVSPSNFCGHFFTEKVIYPQLSSGYSLSRRSSGTSTEIPQRIFMTSLNPEKSITI